MPVTHLQANQQVKLLLSEPVDTPIAELDAGDNPTPVLTSDAVIARYLWEAAIDHCRSCLPVTGAGTATFGVGIAGWQQRLDAFTVTQVAGVAAGSGAVPASGCTLWAASRLYSMSGDILRQGKSQFDAKYGTSSSPAANPTNWTRYSQNGIVRIGPPLSSSSLITAEGLILPAQLADINTDTVGFSYMIPDDHVLNIICAHAAYMVALGATDDQQTAMRKPELVQRVNEGRTREFARLDDYTQVWAYGGSVSLLNAGEAPKTVAQGRR